MLKWNDEIKWILGRPNFAVAQLAHRLRALKKYDIKRNAEEEQAAAIHWMLCMYEKYGDKWRDQAEKELKDETPVTRSA